MIERQREKCFVAQLAFVLYSFGVEIMAFLLGYRARRGDELVHITFALEKRHEPLNIFGLNAAENQVVWIDHDVGANIAQVDRSTVVDQQFTVQPAANNLQTKFANQFVGAFLGTVGGRANEYVPGCPIHCASV